MHPTTHAEDGHSTNQRKVKKCANLRPLQRKWHTVAEVAEMLGYGESKVRMLIAQRDIRSVRDGGSRRILPQWVDEYIEQRIEESYDD